MPNNDQRPSTMKERIVLTVAFIALFIFIITADFAPQGKVYDCGMAEWHPDIPTEVREECRKMRREFYEQEQRQFEKKSIST